MALEDKYENTEIAVKCQYEMIEAAAPKDGEKASNPKFKMTAYTGGRLKVGYEHDVVIDLEGLDWTDKARPILLEHCPDDRLGFTTSITIVDGNLVVEGELCGTSEKAQAVIGDAKNGFPFQASVGVSVKTLLHVGEGESLDVNGTPYDGDIFVAVATQLNEVSFVSLGADDATTVKVAAKKADEGDLTVADNKDTGIEDLKAARVAEHKRIAGIEAACKGNSELIAKHIEADSTVEAAKIEALEAQLEASKVVAPVVGTGASISAAANDLDVLEASALKSAGFKADEIVAELGETAFKAARHTSGIGLHGLVLECARRAGNYSTNAKDSSTILAAFTPIGGLGGLLSNIGSKILGKDYPQAGRIIDVIAAVQTVTDFKQTPRYVLTVGGGYNKVNESGELENGSIDIVSSTVQADTYGELITLTRKMLIDDDLGAFNGLFEGLRRRADGAKELAGMGALIDTAGFFSAGNDNYATGGDTALSINALSKAEELLSLQLDASGNALGLVGKYLVVPPALKAIAEQLVVSKTITGNANGDDNIHAGKFEVMSSPLLQVGTLTNKSADAWYLLADPYVAPAVTMSYLNGEVNPHLERVDLTGNQLGTSFRVYSDFGADACDFRGAVKMAGA